MEEQMTPEALAAYLQELERQAATFRSTELQDEQAAAIDFYESKPFGDEQKGRSQVIVPVVQETVDYMTVSVLRTFISGDRVVEFDASHGGEQDAAEEATEGVNQQFMRGQDGVKVLQNWLQTGLLEKIGVVKSTCIVDPRRKRERAIVTAEELAVLSENGVEVLQATEGADGTLEILAQTTSPVKRYADMPVPNYEFLFSPRTRHEDDSDYLCHRCRKTVSELIEMGFDRDMVEALSGYDAQTNTDTREAATWDDEVSSGWESDAVPGMRRVMLREEYARIDYDGDGVAELLRVFRVGNKILDAEEVEWQPFTVFCPFPRAHRMVGNSLADKVMDLQRNQSVIMRQTFDGFYLTNAPRMYVDMTQHDEQTIDDLLTVAPGVIVRGKGQAPTPLSQPYDVSRSIALIEFLKGEQEGRTGITRLNQGLDADTLNKTATGQAQLQAQGQQIEEYVARNFAEALARLFQKKLKLMREHGDPVSLRLGGEYREVDPQQWPEDMDVLIRVGLGSGRKEQRMAYRMQAMQMQREALQIGLTDPARIYKAASGFIRDAQLGDPNDYFIDPDGPDAQQSGQGEQVPPEVQAAQVKVQGQVAVEQMRMAAKAETERAKLEADIALQREENAAEAELARERMLMEAALNGATAEQRPGGSLAA